MKSLWIKTRRSLKGLIVLVFCWGSLAHGDEKSSSLDSSPKELSLENISRDNHVSSLIYVNRCKGGCIFTPGPSDARSNISSIVRQTSSVSEFPFSDLVFEQTIDCLRDVYEPYDVEIVTEDPGDQFHHEAVLAGTAAEIGQIPAGGFGSNSGQCQPKDNGISFTFARTLGSNAENLCSVLAQETAHSFGMSSHTFDCHDPMTYLRACGRQYFRNIRYPCGEFSQDPQCSCGGNTRNNHLALVNALGRSETVLEKPLLLPLDFVLGEEVAEGVVIQTTSQDKRGIYRVELWISGSMVDSQAGNLDSPTNPNRPVQVNFRLPEWPDGYMDLEIRAYNDLEDFTSETVRVLKGEPCVSDDACNVSQECIEGGCRFPRAIAGLADNCNVDENCLEGICVEHQGAKECALACVPGIQDACVEGFICSASGGCVPQSKESSGFCSAGNGHKSLAMLFLLFFCVCRFNRRKQA